MYVPVSMGVPSGSVSVPLESHRAIRVLLNTGDAYGSTVIEAVAKAVFPRESVTVTTNVLAPAANRIGTEKVNPCEENGNQTSSLCFYGSSFLTDETGDVISKASRDKEEIIYAEYNFEENRKMRSSWGLFRDRRPECYGDIVR
jgi:hypothetical protein